MINKKELIALWKKNNFKPNKRFGQNFLIDNNVKDKLIEYVNPESSDEILEIGPGFGEMTLDLSAKAKKIVAVEKDKRIVTILKERIVKQERNVEIVESDFLKYNLKKRFTKVVGNLPYYVTTPIIEKLLLAKDKIKKSVFIMVQKEYGQRMSAAPGTKDYSSLTCFLKFNTLVEKLMTIKKTCFFPSPKVDSMFIKLSPLPSPPVKVRSEEILFKIIRSSFQQRRKTLVNSISTNSGMDIDKAKISGILGSLDIDGNIRPERLELEDFAKIADRIYYEQ